MSDLAGDLTIGEVAEWLLALVAIAGAIALGLYILGGGR